MQFFYEFLDNHKNDKTILFINNSNSYYVRDLKIQSLCVFKRLFDLKKNRDLKEIYAITDNSFMFASIMVASWLLNINIIQPNSVNEFICDYHSSCYFFTDDENVIKVLTDNNQVASSELLSNIVTGVEPDFSFSNEDKSLFENFIHKKALENDDYFKGVYLIQQTSGSTGKPKFIKRSAWSLQREVETLSLSVEKFKDCSNNSFKYCFISTVPLFHAYGIIFRFLLPLFLKQISLDTPIKYQEQLSIIDTRDYKNILVSSPAFYKRLDAATFFSNYELIISAGGKLDNFVLQKALNCFKAELLEIYGSTETGIIGYRYPKNSKELWRAARGNLVGVNNNKDEMIVFSSPYINNGKPFIGEDLIKLVNDGFILVGRPGRVIKIEDNRICLDDVETVLRNLNLIADCAAVLYTRDSREYVGAVIVLTDEGKAISSKLSIGKFSLYLRQLLVGKIISLAIPRSFIIVDKISETANTKVDYKKIKEMFL